MIWLSRFYKAEAKLADELGQIPTCVSRYLKFNFFLYSILDHKAMRRRLYLAHADGACDGRGWNIPSTLARLLETKTVIAYFKAPRASIAYSLFNETHISKHGYTHLTVRSRRYDKNALWVVSVPSALLFEVLVTWYARCVRQIKHHNADYGIQVCIIPNFRLVC